MADVAVLAGATYAYTSADKTQHAVTIEFHANTPMSGYQGEVKIDTVRLYRPKAFSIDLEQIA